MTVSTFVPTAAGNQSVNTYTGAIDGDFSVLTRLGVAFAPHAQAIPNMTVAVDAGHIFNGNLIEVPPQTTAAIVAPTTNPRIDRVVIDRLTGVVSVVTGTESTTPIAPAFPAGTVPVARVLLQPAMIAITNDAITDERSLYSLGSSGSTGGGGGGLLNVQVFSTPGTYTYTPTAGTTKIIVEVQGAGGPGGPADSDPNKSSAGGGGGSGAYAKSFLISGFAGAAIVVGASGPVPAAGYGGPGEPSSFGTITAPGGFMGIAGNATNAPNPPVLNCNNLPLNGLVATGGNIVNSSCGVGEPGYILGSSESVQSGMCQIIGGTGAASRFGAGGIGGRSNVSPVYGQNAGSPGAGGGGAICLGSEPGGKPGAKGGDGVVIVYEYA